MPSQEEKKEVINSTKGFSSSLFFHSILILIGITPLATFNAPIWEEEQPGMEVALGFPDEGMGSGAASPGELAPGPPGGGGDPEPPSKSDPAPTASASDPAPSTPSQPEPSPTKSDNVVTSDISEEVAAAKAKEEKRKKAEQEQIEAERRRNAELAAEAARKAEAERRAKEKAQREADLAKAKSGYGDKFKKKGDGSGTGTGSGSGGAGGTGDGRGDTGKPGNQGDPNGDPNADNLKGVHTGGKGRIGGGLGNRGVVKEPKIAETTQKTGRVVVKVCVNAQGNVVSAEYTQKGSTTNDATLINIATKNARQFKFTEGDVTEQCGTITYDFIVK